MEWDQIFSRVIDILEETLTREEISAFAEAMDGDANNDFNLAVQCLNQKHNPQDY